MVKKKAAKTAAEADDGGSKLRFRSPAEFFAENKNIAGFDNPGKSLYTTIRELVENGLDAAESVPVLPVIDVVIDELSVSEFNKMVGIDDRERLDETLYKDVETGKERKRREAKEKREAKKRKNQPPDNHQEAKKQKTNPPEESDANVKVKAESQTQPESSMDGTQDLPSQMSSQPTELPSQLPPSEQPSQPSQPSQLSSATQKGSRGDVSTLSVFVSDNGIGMAHDDVPDMLGRVLAGTKYCVKQSRGKFGLGSKMALIWSKMSTSLPVDIRTAKAGCEITHCVLDIDISKNIPNVIVHEKLANENNWRGTEVKVTIQGSWTTYRAKILQYMRQMAVITPYAQFNFKFNTPRAEKSFEVSFSRRSDQMPPEPEEVKHHPASLNQLLLKQLVSNLPGKTPLVRFLTRELSNIDKPLAERLIKELGETFSLTMPISELGLNEIRMLDKLLKEARFGKPNGECLSPAGEYNLRLGIMKELRPDLVATHAESADAFEGHPFIVEAGVSLGGDNVRNGLSIYRFANRIPLLFEQGNDIVTRTAQDIPWGQYKISANTDRIGVFCSIVSTKIPFKGTGKEYIGDDSPTIKQSVRKAIQSCCVQLKTKLARRAELKSRQDRSRNLKRYIPDVANAIMKFFESVKTPTVSAEYVRQMQTGVLTKEVLEKKLSQHVETSDRQNVVELGSIFGYVHEQAEFVHLAPRAETDMYSKPILLQVMPAGEGATQPPQVGIQFLESLRVIPEEPEIERVAAEDEKGTSA